MVRPIVLAHGGSRGSAARGGAPSGRVRGVPRSNELPTLHKLRDITPVTRFGVGGTDLGIPCRVGDEVLYVFGDTFEGLTIGAGDWRSPVGLFGNRSGAITRPAGPDPKRARQLLDYRHDTGEFTTILPTTCIEVDGALYLHTMRMQSLDTVVRTGLYRSDDGARSWREVAQYNAGHADGCWVMWALCPAPDGYTYNLSTGGLTRSNGLRLHRMPTETLGTLRDGINVEWEPWGWREDTGWQWGNPPTDLALGRGYGELSLSLVDDTWVMTYFDAAAYRIAARFADSVDGRWSEPVTLLQGGSWEDEDHAAGRVAQLYGGYLVPGSTLSAARVVVSQWNTVKNHPYKSMMFTGPLRRPR
ncbi:DUF4185 domain-containing protein [Tsukamurella sp. 1534]|uniref:DUF4185 domain-containing protein n=1 Tax=Tsukamurella sp. 1534 TaxID=1151061 RepID=UPI0006ACF4A1|nr:DUF4185 domain-containing protein [Tsukamurella sp. 1534]